MIYTKFKGKINGKTIWDFTNQIDYNIDKLEDRVLKLHKILNTYKVNGFEFCDDFFEIYFNKYFNTKVDKKDGLSDTDLVCKKLELMADYLIYADKKSWIKEKRKRHKIYKKEIPSGGLIDLQEINNNEDNKKSEKNRTDIALKVTNKDRQKYKELHETGKAIKLLKHMLKTGITCKGNKLNNKDVYKCKRFIKFLYQDEKIIKKSLIGYIEFKKPGFYSTKYNFDSDTGYYLDNGDYKLISENRIDLGNYRHIYNLILYYSDLKQQHYEDVNSDMRYIIYTLEWLIEQSNFDDWQMDLIKWKIEKKSNKKIIEDINWKYGFNFNIKKLLAELYRICKIISMKYLDTYEEWFYTFKAKADYKICSKCGKTYVASRKYFSPDKRNKDGLRSICKKCRNYAKNWE
jgi:hypothetical protein